MKNSAAILLIGLLSAVSATVFSQVVSQQPLQIYRTIKGDIAITLLYKDTAIIAASNQLLVLLDYETSRILFKVQYETFHTGTDSLDNKFKSLKGQELAFEGKLGIFVNTKKYTPQKYNMQGAMTSISYSFTAEGNGTVLCMAPGNNNISSCKLIAAIKCKLSDLNLTDVFKNADNNIQIDIRQSLLEKNTQ